MCIRYVSFVFIIQIITINIVTFVLVWNQFDVLISIVWYYGRVYATKENWHQAGLKSY